MFSLRIVSPNVTVEKKYIGRGFPELDTFLDAPHGAGTVPLSQGGGGRSQQESVQYTTESQECLRGRIFQRWCDLELKEGRAGGVFEVRLGNPN